MKKFFRIIGVLAVIGMLTAILLYIFVYNKPHPDYAKVKPRYTLTAEELFRSYQTDDSAAMEYTGAVVQISGQVARIDRIDSLVIAVMVFEEGLFGEEGIRCTMLPGYHQQTEAIAPDQQVTIKGLCTGYNDTDVILEKCSIIE